jgi:hypothetical protein
MLWPAVSAVGFVVMTGLVVVLARSRTAHWERERRRKPDPLPEPEPEPEPERAPGRLTRVRRAVEVRAAPVTRAAARVHPGRAVHAGGDRVRALRARVHRPHRGAATPVATAGRGRHLGAVHLGPAGIRLPLPLPDRLRRRRGAEPPVTEPAGTEPAGTEPAGTEPVLLPQDAEGPEIPVGDRADPAPQP